MKESNCHQRRGNDLNFDFNPLNLDEQDKWSPICILFNYLQIHFSSMIRYLYLLTIHSSFPILYLLLYPLTYSSLLSPRCLHQPGHPPTSTWVLHHPHYRHEYYSFAVIWNITHFLAFSRAYFWVFLGPWNDNFLQLVFSSCSLHLLFVFSLSSLRLLFVFSLSFFVFSFSSLQLLFVFSLSSLRLLFVFSSICSWLESLLFFTSTCQSSCIVCTWCH